MARETRAVEQFYAELEALGESKVRERLALSVYGDAGDRRRLVLEWLRLKDQERLDRRENQRNTMETIAAIAAIIAAVAATIGAIASVITLFSE